MKQYRGGSHTWKNFGFIEVEVIRNANNEVIERRIYILDNSINTYCSKKQYPYCQNNQYPIDDNIKKNNIKLKIDRLYYCVINNQMDYYDALNQADKQEFIRKLKELELNYNKDITQYFSKENETKIKIIMYSLSEIIQQKHSILIKPNMRATLVYIYDKCKNKENEYKNAPNEIVNFYEYYYKSVMLELYKN